jgi:hypothetical protein
MLSQEDGMAFVTCVSRFLQHHFIDIGKVGIREVTNVLFSGKQYRISCEGFNKRGIKQLRDTAK